MKKLVKVSALALAVGLSCNAVAAHKGFNIGGQLGATLPDLGSFPSESANYNHFGAGFLGGYNFAIGSNMLIGAEFGFNYLGSFDFGDSTPYADNLYNWDLLGVFTYNINEKFGVFVKAGITQQMLVQTNDTDNNYANKALDVAPEIAFGGSYNITKNWEIYSQFSHIFGNELLSSGLNLDNGKALTYNNIWFGFKYNF